MVKIAVRKKEGWCRITRQCQLAAILFLGVLGFFSLQVVYHKQHEKIRLRQANAVESETLHERINRVGAA